MIVIPYCRGVIVKFTSLGMGIFDSDENEKMDWQPGQLSDVHVIQVRTAGAPQPPQQAEAAHFSSICRFPRLFTAAMAHPSRRVPSPNPRYYSVPQSPQHPNHPYGQQQPQHQPRRPSRSNRTQPASDRPAVAPMPPRNDLAQGVATGAIGAGYGPYSVRLSSSLQIFTNSI